MLHCCWLIDPWKDSRNVYLEGWLSLGVPITLWHAGQLEAPPHTQVLLRDAQALFPPGHLLKEAWEYELYHRNHAACSDILRYEVLYQLGGGYFDLDVLPHPERMDAATLHQLLATTEITFGSLSAVRHLHGDVEIRFICSGKGHRILRDIRYLAAQRTHEYIEKGGHTMGVSASGIMTRTGPILATQVLQEHLERVPEERREEQLRRWLFPFATKDDTIDNMREHLDRRFHEIDRLAGYDGLPAKRRCAPPEIPGGRRLNVRPKHPFLYPGKK